MPSRVHEQKNPRDQIISEFTIRPHRFAYIINRSVSDTVLGEVYQYNSSLWGGKYNLFVPSDGKTIRNDWIRQIYTHDPDYIFMVGEIEASIGEHLYNLLQPTNVWRWDSGILKSLAGEPIKVNPLLMRAILELIVKDKGKLLPYQSRIRYPKVSGKFKTYFDMICGSWSPESRYQEYTEHNLGGIEINIKPIGLGSYLNALDKLNSKLMPLDLTTQYLQTSYTNIAVGGYSLIFSKGDLDDIFIYHALSWSQRSSEGLNTCVIIPMNLLKTSNDYKRLAEWFGARVKGNTFDIISYSVEMDTLIEVRKKLKQYLPDRQMGWTDKRGWVINIERCNIEAPTPNVTHLTENQVVNTFSNEYSFSIPTPTFFEHVRARPYEHKSWMCDANLFPGLMNKRGFAPSMFADLNLLLSRYTDDQMLMAHGSPVRIARGDFALPVTSRSHVGSIHIPSNRETIEAACRSANYEIGKTNSVYYQGLLNLLGSLEEANFLHNPRILDLFRHPPLLREEALTLMEMYTQLSVKKDMRADFDNWIQILASKEILLRGYKLECPVCGLEAWYELGRVGEHMICDGCRANFQIPIELFFAYRLNRLFIDRNNHGTITVLLTLLVLYETTRHGLIWQADIKLTKNNKEIEVDVIAMCDGYLIVAECKNRFLPHRTTKSESATNQKNYDKAVNDLKKQLENEIALAADLNAHLFLFATLEVDVPKAITDFLDEQNKLHDRMEIRLLSNSELTKGKFTDKDGKDSRVSMYDLAFEYAYPQFHIGTDCNNHDENFPYGAVSVW